MGNTFLMVNISSIYEINSLDDESMLITYLMQGEKVETWFVSPANSECFGTKPTTFQSTN